MIIDIQKIISEYSILKNIWKVGELNNLTGQRVHFLLNKNGIDTSRKGKWDSEQENELMSIYENGFLCDDGTLDAFCKKTGKLKSNVCRKARELGLKTTRERKFSEKQINRLGNQAKNWIKEKGHPKGMLGKTHTEENKKKLSQRSFDMWANPSHVVNSKEYRQELSNRSSKNMSIRLETNAGSIYSRGKRGTIEIGGKKIFARSSWEANIASYFEFLKTKDEIKEWEHEPKTFWFLQIKRGVRSYKPDFLITKNDGTQYYEEVKGWMDNKSKTKIKRMAKYYPEIELRILDEKRYNAIKKAKNFIPNWGMLDNVTNKKP